VNVARHSGAEAASLVLTRGPEQLVLQVRDDGHGFDAGGTSQGLGLRSMRERVQAIGGHLALESGPQGTVVTVTVPLPKD
jgi:two-component system NarL family sensor kinase